MHHSNSRLALGVVVLAASALSACQTVGDNKLLFVTDTKFALDVSGEPTGQPSFTLGYKRREAILLPLSSGTWGKPTHLCITSAGKLQCESVTKEPTRGSHVCIEAKNASEANATSDGHNLLCDTAANVIGNLYAASVSNGTTKDAYSVMASFGLDSSSGGAKVAQFIATGIAAQNLTKKEISPLINPNAITPDEAQRKIVDNQVSYLDKITKKVVKNGAVDKTELDGLLDKVELHSTTESAISELSGKSEAEFRNTMNARFQSSLEALANAVTEA